VSAVIGVLISLIWYTYSTDRPEQQTFNDGIIKFYESHGGMYTEGQDQRLLITIEGYGDLVPADKIMEFIDRSWEIFRLFKK